MIFRAAPSTRHQSCLCQLCVFNVEQPRKIRLHPPAKKQKAEWKLLPNGNTVHSEKGFFFLPHNGALVFGLTSCSNVSRRKPGRPDCGTCSCPQPVASASWTTHSSLRRRDAWLSPRKSLTARLPVKHPTRAARSKF